ncbi:MAG: hypothetical protein GX490_00270 [Bacilli bacterium]|nr:hypothetical protein [Bacilli bacterium]
MLKKIGLVIASCFTLLFTMNNYTFANQIRPEVVEPQDRFTSEDKRILKEKMDELKHKYFSNWKNMTKDERKQALKQYELELDKFCKEKYGLSFSELKEKYPSYFKRKYNKKKVS